MTLQKWSDEFCTHIRAIDDDHKGLFDSINALHDSHLSTKSNEQINSVIVLLNNYVNDHFDREERFMEQAGYPDIDEHKKSHKEFRDEFLGLRSLYHSDPEAVNIEKVVVYLFTWLQKHILGTDMLYVPYLRGEKQGERPFSSTQEQTEEFIRLTVRVPSAKADLIENFIDVIADHDISENIELLMKEIYERKLEKARSLFT